MDDPLEQAAMMAPLQSMLLVAENGQRRPTTADTGSRRHSTLGKRVRRDSGERDAKVREKGTTSTYGSPFDMKTTTTSGPKVSDPVIAGLCSEEEGLRLFNM
jgi:hypothetical protein